MITHEKEVENCLEKRKEICFCAEIQREKFVCVNAQNMRRFCEKEQDGGNHESCLLQSKMYGDIDA